MAVLQGPFGKVATALIKALGVKSTEDSKPILRVVRKSYNPADGTGTERKTEYPLNITPPAEYSLNQVDGESILKGDFKVMFPRSDIDFDRVVPDECEFVLNNSVYKVVTVTPINAGAQAAAYTLQCRLIGEE